MNEETKAEIKKLLNDEFKAELLKAVRFVCLGEAVEINDEIIRPVYDKIIRPVYEPWRDDRELLNHIDITSELKKEIMTAQDEVRKANPEIYEKYVSSIDDSIEVSKDDYDRKEVITVTLGFRLFDRLDMIEAKEATKWLCVDCIYMPHVGERMCRVL